MDIQKPRTIVALTGLRGVAVLLVLFGHLAQYFFIYGPKTAWFGELAYLGMTLFFVLSGFVIHLNYGELFTLKPWRDAWTRFFVARFSRLFPLYIVVILFGASFSLEQLGWINIGLHLIMMQSLFPLPNVSMFNTWSVSTEWFFYVIYALAIANLVARWKRSPVLLFLIVIATSFAILEILRRSVDPHNMFLLYSSPYVRILEFLTGVIAAEVYLKRHASFRWAWIVLLLTIVAYNNFALAQFTFINYLFAPAFACLIVASSMQQSFYARIFSPRWLMWIGDRSYSIYLVQAIILVMFFTNKSARDFSAVDALDSLLKTSAVVIPMLILSDLLWRFVEKWSRKRLIEFFTGTNPADRAKAHGGVAKVAD